MLYTRAELRLLVALAAVLLCGLAVREWRAGFPDLADRLERFDQDEAPADAAADTRADRSGAPSSRTPAEAPGGTALDDSGEVAAWGDPAPPATEAGARANVGRAQVDQVGAQPGRSHIDQVDAPPPADPRPLDLNRATLDELSRLPGVGLGLAQRIVAERQRRGRFDSPESLRSVLGMGPKKLSALRDLVTVGE